MPSPAARMMTAARGAVLTCARSMVGECPCRDAVMLPGGHRPVTSAPPLSAGSLDPRLPDATDAWVGADGAVLPG